MRVEGRCPATRSKTAALRRAAPNFSLRYQIGNHSSFEAPRAEKASSLISISIGRSEAVAARAVVELVGAREGGAHVRIQRRRCGLGGWWSIIARAFFEAKAFSFRLGKRRSIAFRRLGKKIIRSFDAGLAQFAAAALPKAPICCLKL